MKMSFRLATIAFGCLIAITLPACGKKKSSAAGESAGLPLVTPPVKAATPAGLLTTTSLHLTAGSLTPSDFKSRFFTPSPTNVFDILKNIDDRISGLNTQSASISPPPSCLSQAPLSYTLTPWGPAVTMWGQCYEKITTPDNIMNDPLLIQWGIKDGVTYLYYAIGAERIGVVATPSASDPTQNLIHAWIGLGYPATGSTWDAGSYGVMEIEADPVAKTIELTVAGMGFGYCGAQLRSDGTNIYAEGSPDGGACGAAATLCVLASDASTAGTCGVSVTKFSLTPIGRAAAAASATNKVSSSFGASQYPASGTLITINGTTTDALYFGPLTPTAGVGALDPSLGLQ